MVIRINTTSFGGATDMTDKIRKERLDYVKAWREWIGYWVVIFGMWGTSLYITLTYTN